MNHYQINGLDAVQLHLVEWSIEQPAKGIVQISHGMAEHILRYEALATYLNENDYIVVGHDHRGHGTTATTVEDIGYLGESNGWNKLVDEVHLVTQWISAKYPGIPIILFGHSMGSFAARQYVTLYGEDIEGAIFSGTGQNPGWLNHVAKWLAQNEVRRKGGRHRSTLMTSLSFGAFNKKFKPNKTEFDWLSRDEVEVYKYIEDPFCGGVFTAGFYVDFLEGLIQLNRVDRLQQIPKGKPYLFVSGSDDPLSKSGDTIQQVASLFRSVGIQNIQVKIYEQARHELTNEINREEVFADLLAWLELHVKDQRTLKSGAADSDA